MSIINKILHQDPKSREGIISNVSVLGVVVNLLIAIVKVVAGVFASSIAIISEGVNNATDALTSIITLVGTKLAGMHPDEKHPFGYGRIEYLTSLVIAVLILIAGIEMFSSSIKLIFEPEELSISYISLVIIAVSAVVKFFLGVFTIRIGKRVDSGALIGVGVEGRNDSFVSVVTIISAILFLVFGFSIDAYAGAFVSLFIIKAGFDVLRSTISELLGRPGEKELATKLYSEIRSTEGVIAAADMMLHNYGPEYWSGSVNVEMEHKKTVGEIYNVLHKLQLRIMHEYNVVMVFGIYAVDNDHEIVRKIRKDVGAFVKSTEHVKSFHAVYLEPETNKIYCDMVVDYALRDWELVRKSFTEYMANLYPESEIELTIETEFV